MTIFINQGLTTKLNGCFDGKKLNLNSLTNKDYQFCDLNLLRFHNVLIHQAILIIITPCSYLYDYDHNLYNEMSIKTFQTSLK